MKYWHKILGKNKAIELNSYGPDDKNRFDNVECHVDIRKNTDHSGISIFVYLFKYGFEIDFYDVRHWYDEKNRYYFPGEELMLMEDHLLEHGDHTHYIVNNATHHLCLIKKRVDFSKLTTKEYLDLGYVYYFYRKYVPEYENVPFGEFISSDFKVDLDDMV